MATIASGSSGNCTYIGTEDTHILIDAGISMKRTAEGLHALDLDFSDLDAIFVTHEHSDHIQGIPMIEKHHGLPLYATGGTLARVKAGDAKGVIRQELIHVVRDREEVTVGDLTVRPFAISHDAAEPVGYRVTQTAGNRQFCAAVATDMGCFDERIEQSLSGLDVLLLESNHDVRMLQAGPYPYPLKQRILGERGHLSNDAAGDLLSRVLHDGVKGVLLGHLSEMNNLPELAYETVRVEIELSDTPWHGNDFPIDVAPRAMLSRVLTIG